MSIKDLDNKTAVFFEEYQKGLPIAAIALKFGTSRQTVTEYLKKHDKYKPRGKGNKLTKNQGRVIVPRKKLPPRTNISFYLPKDLLDRLNLIGGYLNQTARFIAAINNYLDLKVRDRPKAENSPKVGDRHFCLDLPKSLAKKLDRPYKTELNKTRTDKIIASVELLCKKHKV